MSALHSWSGQQGAASKELKEVTAMSEVPYVVIETMLYVTLLKAALRSFGWKLAI